MGRTKKGTGCLGQEGGQGPWPGSQREFKHISTDAQLPCLWAPTAPASVSAGHLRGSSASNGPAHAFPVMKKASPFFLWSHEFGTLPSHGLLNGFMVLLTSARHGGAVIIASVLAVSCFLTQLYPALPSFILWGVSVCKRNKETDMRVTHQRKVTYKRKVIYKKEMGRAR